MKRKDGRPAYKSILKRYRAQKQRGTQGFGYVAIQDNQVVSYQRAETEHEIVNLISKEKASEILFHHRQPTGTPNMLEMAHPFLVENSLLDHQYFVAHNGVIRNTNELHEAHEKLGIEYSSEMLKAFVSKQGEQYIHGIAWNDSESLAIETALALDGKKKQIDTEGPAAVIGLQTKGKKVVNRFFFRNSLNPLKWHEDKVMITITSMGNGEVVLPEKIYKIQESGGGYAVLSEKFPPFLAYKPSIHSGHSFGRWINGKWVRNGEEEESTTMGYLRNSIKSVGDILGLPNPADDYEVAADTSDDELSWETNALLNDMTMQELWTEYEASQLKSKDLEREIAQIDARTIYTSESVTRREKLQRQFDDRENWQAMIMDEIQARNSKDYTTDERLFK